LREENRFLDCKASGDGKGQRGEDLTKNPESPAKKKPKGRFF